ncbi:MAG: hypothetical protein EBR82_59130, partial [Caulobacteraceae bacterium]|nr:hypothetical protein [Caulobacteraceae bacterium]
MTATQIAINTAINAAVGSVVTNTIKTAVMGGEFDLGQILSGAATSGLTAGAASYLGNTIAGELSKQEWFKNLPSDALRSDIVRGASTFAVNLVRTGDLSQSFVEGLSAGAQGQLNRWLSSAKSSIFGGKSDLVDKWSPENLRKEGFDTGSFNGLSVPKNLSNTAKSVFEKAATDAVMASINGQDPKQAFVNNLLAAGFEVVGDRIQESNLLKPDNLKRQLGIDPGSPMDAKTTAAVDDGIKAAQDAIRNGQDPIAAFGGALVRSGLKYVGGEIKQMTGLDFASKTSTSTATPGVTYYDTGVGGVIGKTT